MIDIFKASSYTMDQPGLLEQNIFITCMRGDHESRSLYTLKQEKRNHLNYLLQMRRLDRARHTRDLIGNEVWKKKVRRRRGITMVTANEV